MPCGLLKLQSSDYVVDRHLTICMHRRRNKQMIDDAPANARAPLGVSVASAPAPAPRAPLSVSSEQMRSDRVHGNGQWVRWLGWGALPTRLQVRKALRQLSELKAKGRAAGMREPAQDARVLG
jgi:hypothetical protein